jgi:hypothetical protein
VASHVGRLVYWAFTHIDVYFMWEGEDEEEVEREGWFIFGEREKWRKEEKSPGNRGKSPHFIK